MSDSRAGGLPVFRFSTASYPAHERVPAWCEVFGRALLKIDITPRSSEAFRASATAYRSSSFGLIDVATTAARQANSRSLIHSDDVCFGVARDAVWHASQLGRSTDLRPGDGLLMNNGDVGSITFPVDCRYFAFAIPRSAIAPLVRDIDALFARRTPASNPALRMLAGYLDLARDQEAITTPELEAAFTNHVCDLLALALGATRDGAELARTRGLRVARLHAIKEDIRRNLSRPNLSVHSIAARHRISDRYVRNLFEETGSTFTRFLMEQRLMAAHKLLSAPIDMPIGAIAYSVGFNDISNFNKAFRQQFACTPRDVRDVSGASKRHGTSRMPQG
jgi:AraC-like DNA-binding protein